MDGISQLCYMLLDFGILLWDTLQKRNIRNMKKENMSKSIMGSKWIHVHSMKTNENNLTYR